MQWNNTGAPARSGEPCRCALRPLGNFPMGNTEMSEEQIERLAERKMDQLDAQLMNGKLSQAEYDAAVKELSRAEIARLASECSTWWTFEDAWENETWWMDIVNAEPNEVS